MEVGREWDVIITSPGGSLTLHIVLQRTKYLEIVGCVVAAAHRAGRDQLWYGQ